MPSNALRKGINRITFWHFPAHERRPNATREAALRTISDKKTLPTYALSVKLLTTKRIEDDYSMHAER